MTLARRLEGRWGAERRRVGRNEVPLHAHAYASAMMHRRTRPRVPAASALDKKNINTVAVPYHRHGAALYSAAPSRRRRWTCDGRHRLEGGCGWGGGGGVGWPGRSPDAGGRVALHSRAAPVPYSVRSGSKAHRTGTTPMDHAVAPVCGRRRHGACVWGLGGGVRPLLWRGLGVTPVPW